MLLPIYIAFSNFYFFFWFTKFCVFTTNFFKAYWYDSYILSPLSSLRPVFSISSCKFTERFSKAVRSPHFSPFDTIFLKFTKYCGTKLFIIIQRPLFKNTRDKLSECGLRQCLSRNIQTCLEKLLTNEIEHFIKD